jgi:hypothetical protein
MQPTCLHFSRCCSFAFFVSLSAKGTEFVKLQFYRVSFSPGDAKKESKVVGPVCRRR